MTACVSSDVVFAQFDEWYAEARACETLAYANAMNLATVNSDGKPSSRMVLLKGRDDDGFMFYTNLHSRKSRQIKNNPYVALCFYWDALGKQVRIEGMAEPTSDAASDAYFATRPRESQLGAWASLQSEMLETRQNLKDAFARVSEEYAGKDVPRPPHWGGWHVTPSLIEFWQEGAHRLHKRVVYSLTSEGWSKTLLNP
ncbi:MAG: pyridoxamine 5'-phosphate oxidase [Alphaproteobacteria bacterium]|nr:pyridoxamine 5'-phosphate oxidase [Alphaproteobacteria bacterium]